MKESSPPHDSKLQRFVQDFDALADWMHTLNESDRRGPRPETASARHLEFTTEWQMVSGMESVRSL